MPIRHSPSQQRRWPRWPARWMCQGRGRTPSPRVVDEIPDDIIVERQHHQAQQQEQSDLLGVFPDLLVDRPTDDQFAEEEEEVAAIQYRYRQQVEYTQIDR